MKCSIISPELADGNTPFASPDGPPISPYGQAPVPVSRFRARDSGVAMPINDTSGPLFTASSPSAALQLSLENRLRAVTDVNGSPEYELTWKHWDMPSGVPICALVASARRTSGNGCTGWPTPVVNDGTGSQYAYAGGDHSKPVLKLPGAAQMAGWATPTTRDHKDGASTLENTPVNGLLGRQVSLSPALTENSAVSQPKRASLNPRFSLWLIGFPIEWARCAERVMRSPRKLQRNSFVPLPEQSHD